MDKNSSAKILEENSKFLVVSMLSIKFSLSYEEAKSVSIEWLRKNINESWSSLLELLRQNKVIYKNKILDYINVIYKEKINYIVAKMKGKQGVIIKDRWYNLKLYKQCFIGSEAVEWLIKKYSIRIGEALGIGEILIEQQIIYHVHNEHSFKNDYLFYRFNTKN